jgi:hypothetical protein
MKKTIPSILLSIILLAPVLMATPVHAQSPNLPSFYFNANYEGSFYHSTKCRTI